VDYYWEEKGFQQKIDLIKGLISVEGNIIFGNTGFNKESISLYGAYQGENVPKRVVYEITMDHIEMFKKSKTIEEVIEIYNSIGYFQDDCQ
jgi:hypothetical protein